MASARATVVGADGRVICASCRVAATFATRLRGLLGRRELAPEEGLLIRPASSIHTFFMRFSIDVVFLDGGGHVLKLVSDVRPWRIALARGARETLELPAGRATAAGLAIGERLRLAEAAR
jgi:uncharacterized membrane protein (UPF0127 family)